MLFALLLGMAFTVPLAWWAFCHRRRGGRMQPEAVVTLQKLKKEKTDKDEKPMVLKTKDDGKFEFRNMIVDGQDVIAVREVVAGFTPAVSGLVVIRPRRRGGSSLR